MMTNHVVMVVLCFFGAWMVAMPIIFRLFRGIFDHGNSIINTPANHNPSRIPVLNIQSWEKSPQNTSKIPVLRHLVMFYYSTKTTPNSLIYSRFDNVTLLYSLRHLVMPPIHWADLALVLNTVKMLRYFCVIYHFVILYQSFSLLAYKKNCLSWGNSCICMVSCFVPRVGLEPTQPFLAKGF